MSDFPLAFEDLANPCWVVEHTDARFALSKVNKAGRHGLGLRDGRSPLLSETAIRHYGIALKRGKPHVFNLRFMLAGHPHSWVITLTPCSDSSEDGATSSADKCIVAVASDVSSLQLEVDAAREALEVLTPKHSGISFERF
ncbi:MAG: hypothetical protein AAGA22_01945 [Pseudomonadota bacterium]